jgi:hypothetical protein
MRAVPLRIALVGAVILVTAACSEAGDRVPERDFAEADVRFSEPFGMVTTVREMRDGRLLVADPLGQALMAVDLAAGTADTIGRVGPGPGEYSQPDLVMPLPGDSSLFADLGNGRLVVLGPDLSFGETFPIAQGEPSGPGMGGMNIVLPQGTDSQGRGGGGTGPDVNDFDWPDVMPAFAGNGVRVTPEGDAWVRRSVSAGGAAEFDVFGPGGELKERVVLPRGREVVGFGREHVYVAQRDEFDLIWLERYRRTT